MPARGTTALYRPIPADFDETFIRLGWTSIEDEFRAHAKTIAKWIEARNEQRLAQGLQSLKEARAAYIRQHGPAKSPVRFNYVMGRTNRRNRLRTVIQAGEEA